MSPAGASRTSLLPTAHGALEYLVTGTAEPTTVFGHGLTGSIDTTRPFGGGVPGRKAYLHFRGHGASSAPETPWTYGALAEELLTVADHVGATRAVGISMGAGAICRVLEQQPDRFSAVVLIIPAVLDRPRHDEALQRLLRMAELAGERDVEGITELLQLEQPADIRRRPDVEAWCRRQAETIVRTEVGRALRTIPREVPLHDRSRLQQVTAPTLVIGQEEDPAHPAFIARELGEALPQATVEILPPGGLMWQHRDRVRRLVGEFLS